MTRAAAAHARRHLLAVFSDQTCAECQTYADEDAHFGPTGNNVVSSPWNGSASRFTDQQYRMASAACDTSSGDSVKAQCFLPHHEPGGAVNKNGVHAAAQRASSVSGKSTASVNTAKAHLRSHYKQLGEDAPSSIGGTSADESLLGFELDPSYVEEYQGRHGAFDGKHTHEHAAMGGQGEDAMHTHEHSHDGNGSHAHGAGSASQGGVMHLADDQLPKEWDAVLILEGVRTTDGREIAPGALKARPTPLPLMMMKANEPGHFGSVQVGNITSVDRDPTTGLVMATGDFDLASDDGKEAARNVGEQRMRWVSGDLSILNYEEVYPEGCDDYGCAVLRITAGEVMGATMVPFPAFPQAVIVPKGADMPAAATAGQEAAENLGMVAGPKPEEKASVIAAGFPVQPPAWWFEDPGFDGPAFGFRIEASGRIYGHVALRGVAHIGHAGRRVEMPESLTDYGHFNTGALQCADGTEVTVGQITYNTSHASLAAGARSAAAHYDDTGTALADVHAGADRYGLWVAGALRPSVTDEQLRALRAASPSGDWRPIGRGRELVAVLAVNVPGFAAPRTAVGMRRAPDGTDTETALVAAGVPEGGVQGSEVAGEVERQLAPYRALLDQLAPIAAERIAAGVLQP